MKRMLAIVLSVFSLQAFANEPIQLSVPAEFDVGVLSYSIEDNKIILNTDLDMKIGGACNAYDKDNRIFIDMARSEPRASIWSTAVFDAAVSYLPLRIKMDNTVCDPKYGWRVADLAINTEFDQGSRHGVRLKQRSQVKAKFVNNEIRSNLYGYPVEIYVTGGRTGKIEISKFSNMSKVEAATLATNNGSSDRRTSISMVIPTGYYYRVSGIVMEYGTIYK